MSQIAEWLNASVSSTHSTIGGMILRLLCCAISHYVARQVKNHARLYTVLALFTGGWSLVAAAIESRLLEPDRPTGLSDRAQDVASFLLVYSGVIPVSTTGASRSFPVTRTKREKWKFALISFSLIRLVDLGVPRSSRGGGTNEINKLRALDRPARRHRLHIGCAEGRAGLPSRAQISLAQWGASLARHRPSGTRPSARLRTSGTGTRTALSSCWALPSLCQKAVHATPFNPLL